MSKHNHQLKHGEAVASAAWPERFVNTNFLIKKWAEHQVIRRETWQAARRFHSRGFNGFTENAGFTFDGTAVAQQPACISQLQLQVYCSVTADFQRALKVPDRWVI